MKTMKKDEINRKIRISECEFQKYNSLLPLLGDIPCATLFETMFKCFFKDMVFSPYFQVMTMSDTIYSLTIRKDINDNIDIICRYNPYGNQSGRFL